MRASANAVRSHRPAVLNLGDVMDNGHHEGTGALRCWRAFTDNQKGLTGATTCDPRMVPSAEGSSISFLPIVKRSSLASAMCSKPVGVL